MRREIEVGRYYLFYSYILCYFWLTHLFQIDWGDIDTEADAINFDISVEDTGAATNQVSIKLFQIADLKLHPKSESGLIFLFVLITIR